MPSKTTAIYGRVGKHPVRDSLETATAAMMAAAKPLDNAPKRH